MTCKIETVQSQFCEIRGDPADGDLCGHSPEDFAEAQLMLEPRGLAWCKKYTTTKAAIYRAAGAIFSDFEQRICDLFRESLACDSVELLGEWEIEYGLPKPCYIGAYPTDVKSRQLLICAFRKAGGVKTLAEILDIISDAIECPSFNITRNDDGSYCLRGIFAPSYPDIIHNVVGGHGVITDDGYGSSAGQPLVLIDPDYIEPETCSILWHSTVGGHTGGVGKPLTQGDAAKIAIIYCLMEQYWPAHVGWTFCED